SSRKRHTRSYGDWSSDVCSSDLGVRVPISIVAPTGQPLDGSGPCLLYGYGAYELNSDPSFSPARLNLLERGMSFAIAHVRGGGRSEERRVGEWWRGVGGGG